MKKDVQRPRRQAPLDRRDWLKSTAVLGTAATLAGTQSAGAAPPRAFIEAYPNQLSYAPGESAKLHISTTAAKYGVEIARIGLKREVVWSKHGLPGAAHPVPEMNAAMVGCDWPVGVDVPIAADWRSGYYRIDLQGTDAAGGAVTGEAFFVVRSATPGKQAKILLQLSTNTYHAYNNWGGSCLYSGPKFPKVSFNRPIQIYETPLRAGADWYNPNTLCAHTWEIPFIRWAEKAGYPLDLAVNDDLEFHPEILAPYKLVLSVGHDEYWSGPMRDSLESYIGDGGNVAFFSGNTCCWQVRFEDQGRTMVSWKASFDQDPVFGQEDRRTLTSLWSNKLLGRPENELTGVGFAYGGYNGLFGEFMSGRGAGTYTVHRPDHWLLAGTGLKRGSEFGAKDGIVGYECDGCEYDIVDGLPVPTGADGTPRDFTMVATGPATWNVRDGSLAFAQQLRDQMHAGETPEKMAEYRSRMGAAVLGTYTRGGTVVTAGTTDWSHGLAGGDPIVDRITRNVLDHLTS